MSLLLRLVIFLLCAVSITACGPIYKKEYQYVPPASKVGMMCVNQCLQSKMMCEQMCQMRQDNCRAQSQQRAMYEFEAYKQAQLAQGRPIKKSLRDFDNSFGCQTSCDCTPAYRTCYASCGGEVYERKVCVAFCDKENKSPL